MYAGALGDNAVERYALFLTSLALSADPLERRTALQRAREHGLDVPRVAIVTAERTIERALDSLPSSVKGPLPNLAKATLEQAEEAELLLVRSIEWTVVEADTYDTALEQANVILRYLLGAHPSRCAFTARAVHLTYLCFYFIFGSSWKGQRGAHAPRHAPAGIGSYWDARGARGRIHGLSPVLHCLGDARASDGVPGARGPTNESGRALDVAQGLRGACFFSSVSTHCYEWCSQADGGLGLGV